MAVIRLDRDFVKLDPLRPWTSFAKHCEAPHRAYFAGLRATYGDDFYGQGGLRGAINRLGPPMVRQLRALDRDGAAGTVEDLLNRCRPLLPEAAAVDCYLGVLFYLAPAATLAVDSRPAIAVGLERFTPGGAPSSPWGKYWYTLPELEEMIPHELCHAARMLALGLPPTPRELTLLDMILLEGTALTFTDRLVGRETLRTFMPPAVFERHRQQEPACISRALAEGDQVGLEPFSRYFGADSPISGYYVGYALCRDYLQRYGAASLPELVKLPSREILRRLA